MTPRVAGKRLVVSAAIVDAVLLLSFATFGRANHDEGIGVAGVLTVAWPFLVAWVVAGVAVKLPREPLSPRRATLAWSIALPFAILGRAIGGRGIDPAFLVVAALFTFACLVGWRVLATLIRR